MKAHRQKRIEEIPQNQNWQRLLQCKFHHQPLIYVCSFPECAHQVVCKTRECIYMHIHNQQIVLKQISPDELRQKLNSSSSKTELVQSHKLAQSQANRLELRNNSIQKKRKQIEQVCEKLSTGASDTNIDSFFQSLQNIQAVAQEIKEEMRVDNRQTKQSVLWIALTQETEIARKLTLEFQQFRNFSFAKREIHFGLFENRWSEVQHHAFQHDGIISLIFTKQKFVVGQFVAKPNGKKSNFCLNSFLFIVDRKGILRKTIVFQSVLAILNIKTETGSVNQLYFDQKGPNVAQLKKVSKVGECLTIERIQTFLAAGK